MIKADRTALRAIRAISPAVVRRPSSSSAGGHCEILAVDELHRQKELALDLSNVVHAADVRVRHLARRANLVVKLRESYGVASHVVGQELQCDRLSESQIVGAIDLSHPAAAEESDHAVAAVENRPGGKAAVADGVG
jgi:hypothetical protein